MPAPNSTGILLEFPSLYVVDPPGPRGTIDLGKVVGQAIATDGKARAMAFLNGPTIKTVLRLSHELHSWRSDKDTEYAYNYNYRHGAEYIPFCTDCADWHNEFEPHSATDLDENGNCKVGTY